MLHSFVNISLLLLALLPVGASATNKCTQEENDTHPILCHMIEQLASNPQEMANHIYQHALENKLLVGGLDDWWPEEEGILSSQTRHRLLRNSQKKSSNQLPVVFAHGMGDSCFNSGMQSITKKAGEILDTYSVCIPTGSSQSEDTSNGYFLDMDSSVDVFAAKVQNDTQLKNGFHAIGFSQGNNVIRGYIAKYNTGNAIVHSFLSINGVNAGEGAVPHCVPSIKAAHTGSNIKFDFCELLMEQASNAAYTDFAQKHNFQANYWRDPRPSAFSRYQESAQLAKWNNEAGFINQTLNDNWAKTSTFVWVLAKDDNMVFPREGEHWAAPDPSAPFDRIIPMKETEWYKQDLFGLKTADLAGKNYFESFEGDHLQFSIEDFTRWLQTHLVNQ
mmetsp:Transcript_29893/g.82058  ORF Transcript_29893/g.82058 Transcript_29893/m.82058 type:complete len:389 (+) Transcript_29893:81-1247(+)